MSLNKKIKIGIYDFEWPIIQAGMGVGISLVQMAIASSKNGVVPVVALVGTGYYSSDEAIIDSIYAIITFEGNYSIIQITNKDSTNLSFKWKYQPNGSPNFP